LDQVPQDDRLVWHCTPEGYYAISETDTGGPMHEQHRITGAPGAVEPTLREAPR